MEVTCRCGYTTRGTQAEVIREITAHAKADHALVMTPADVRAIWREVEEPAPGVPAGGES